MLRSRLGGDGGGSGAKRCLCWLLYSASPRRLFGFGGAHTSAKRVTGRSAKSEQ